MDDFARKIDAHTVQFVRILPGPIERIWAFLWDGEKRGEWFAKGAMPTKPGEPFEMRFKHSTLSPHQAEPPEKMREMDKTGHNSRNVLLAYEPPHRLVFSFGPDAREDSEVEFVLTEEGEKVRLTLNHRKIPNRKYAIDVSGGWHSHLAILQDKAEGKVPPAFWDVWRQYDGVYDKRRLLVYRLAGQLRHRSDILRPHRRCAGFRLSRLDPGSQCGGDVQLTPIARYGLPHRQRRQRGGVGAQNARSQCHRHDKR